MVQAVKARREKFISKFQGAFYCGYANNNEDAERHGWCTKLVEVSSPTTQSRAT